MISPNGKSIAITCRCVKVAVSLKAFTVFCPLDTPTDVSYQGSVLEDIDLNDVGSSIIRIGFEEFIILIVTIRNPPKKTYSVIIKA